LHRPSFPPNGGPNRDLTWGPGIIFRMQNTRWLTEIKTMLISPAPGIEEGCFARDDPTNETYETDLMIQIDPSHARVILILFSNSLNDSIFPIGHRLLPHSILLELGRIPSALSFST